MSRPRVRINMNTGTRVMQDKRTARRRTRAADELTALWEEEYDLAFYDDCDGTCRAGRYCVQHGDLVPDFIEP